MRKLGKKVYDTTETIEAYCFNCTATCACYCDGIGRLGVANDDTDYTSKYNSNFVLHYTV